MPSKFFDWLSTLRPRQLLAMSAGAAVIMFAVVFIALTTITEEQSERTMPTLDTDAIQTQMKTVVVASKNIEPKTMLNSKVLELKELLYIASPILHHEGLIFFHHFLLSRRENRILRLNHF